MAGRGSGKGFPGSSSSSSSGYSASSSLGSLCSGLSSHSSSCVISTPSGSWSSESPVRCGRPCVSRKSL
eukprot:2161165-Prymnesium_polylepis.1